MHFRKSNFKRKMKRLQIPQKIVHKKNLHTRNCRRKFIISLLPQKRKENI